MSQSFRILSLAGGGARGIFQAAFLRRLEQELNIHVKDEFDLIAGTSTGAILALGIALDVSLQDLVDFYRTKSAMIFQPRRFSGLRRGPRYQQESLRKCLTEVFQKKELRDTEKRVVITASALDRFNHRVFTNIPSMSGTDGSLSAVEVALASAAAPTYFSPVKPESEERSYADGGMWANSPALLALLIANYHLDVPLADIRLVSVGNGHFPGGTSPGDAARLRPLSVASVRTVLQLMWGCQASFADEFTNAMLAPDRCISVDVPLERQIQLDDVKAALELLPALAEKEAQQVAPRVAQLLFTGEGRGVRLQSRPTHRLPNMLVRELLPAAGMTAFYPSRDFYGTHRRAAGRIDSYVAQAEKTLVMVSINLMTGIHFDDLCAVLRSKLASQTAGFQAMISLLDPNSDHLMHALAPSLDQTPRALAGSVRTALSELLKLKDGLPQQVQERFTIHVHRSIPFGSAIMLDHREASGRIQIETKVYKARFNSSFAFELAPTGSSGLYDVLAKGYEELIKDGVEVSAQYLASAASEGG
jgi:hypothetical protein